MDVRLDGVKVGELNEYNGKKFYTTYRDYSTFFRNFKGFGISTAILSELEGTDVIRIIYYERGVGNYKYVSKVKDWYEKGKPYIDPKNACNRQRILAIKDMGEVVL